MPRHDLLRCMAITTSVDEISYGRHDHIDYLLSGFAGRYNTFAHAFVNIPSLDTLKGVQLHGKVGLRGIAIARRKNYGF
ncbi:hypothetical protein PM082_007416 [Marasmius tenuissimus]|nr:hypothetical protein PM082_007416 [Marasmius tenuissimus]